MVCRLFGPADQKPAESVVPAQRTFDFPAARRFSRIAADSRALLRDRPNMAHEFQTREYLTHKVITVAFVQADVLRPVIHGTRTRNRQSHKRLFQEFAVMPVGAIDHHIQRRPMAFDEHRAFDAQFAAIHRTFPGFFFPRAEPCSSTRPHTSTASRCRSGSQSLPDFFDTTAETPQPWSIPGNADGRRSVCRGWFDPTPSTGNRSPEHTRWRGQSADQEAAGGGIPRDGFSAGAPAIGVPKSATLLQNGPAWLRPPGHSRFRHGTVKLILAPPTVREILS